MNRPRKNQKRGRREMWIRDAERLMAVAMLLSILGSMAAQVVARYVFHAPLAWSEEWARFAMIWLAFLAAAFVMAEQGHIAVDVVSSRLSRGGKAWLACLSNGLVVLACLLVLACGARFVWRVGVVESPALGISMSAWYGAASVGFGLMALHCLGNTLATIRRGRAAWDIPAAACAAAGTQDTADADRPCAYVPPADEARGANPPAASDGRPADVERPMGDGGRL